MYDKPKDFKDVYEIKWRDRYLERSIQNRVNTKSLLTCRVQNSTEILFTKSRYMDHIIKEATETELYPNMKKEDGLVFSRS